MAPWGESQFERLELIRPRTLKFRGFYLMITLKVDIACDECGLKESGIEMISRRVVPDWNDKHTTWMNITWDIKNTEEWAFRMKVLPDSSWKQILCCPPCYTHWKSTQSKKKTFFQGLFK